MHKSADKFPKLSPESERIIMLFELKELVGSRGTARRFVAIQEIIDKPYVGYVMDKVIDHKPLNTYLIPDKDLPFAEWYNKGRGFRERIFIGYIIAKAFGELEKSKRNLISDFWPALM